MSEEKKSIFRSPKEILADLFLEKNAEALADFTAELQGDSLIASNHRGHRDRLDSQRQKDAAIKETFDFLSQVDFAANLHTFIKNNGASFDTMTQGASGMLPAYFLKMHAKEILEISAKELAEHEAGLAAFEKKNHAVLKRLGNLG